MTPSTLQGWIDLLLGASRQQWLLRTLILTTPLASILLAVAPAGRWWPPGIALVLGLSIAVMIRPDSHHGLSVAVVCAWHWAALDIDVTTPWLPLAAVCLFVFHSAVALAAGLPNGTEIPRELLVRWAGRTAIAAAITVAVWLLVVVFERVDLRGNGLLTGLALAVVAVSAFAIRAGSVTRPEEGEPVPRR